jgi:hypothetical protein
MEGANKEEPYPIASRVSTFGEEKSRVFDHDQVVSELDSVCILQAEEARGERVL